MIVLTNKNVYVSSSATEKCKAGHPNDLYFKPNKQCFVYFSVRKRFAENSVVLELGVHSNELCSVEPKPRSSIGLLN